MALQVERTDSFETWRIKTNQIASNIESAANITAVVLTPNANTIRLRVAGTTSNIFFATNNTDRVRIDAAGNVSIGSMSTSGYKFSITGGAKSQFFNTDASSSYYYTDGNYYFGATGANSIVAITSNSERFRIDPSGNVGIGGITAAPLATLHFSGGAVANGDGDYFGGGATYYGGSWRNTISNMGGWAIRNGAGTFSIYTGNNNAAAGSVLNLAERLAIDSTGNVGFGLSASPVMKILSTGWVGIGTTTPVSRLSIVDNPSSGSVLEVLNTSSTQNQIGGITLKNGSTSLGSNVIIGSAVRDSNGSNAYFTINKVTGSTNTYSQTLAYYDLSDGFWTFAPNGVEKVRITSAGLGIGTSTPRSNLEVEGGLTIGNTASTAYVTLNAPTGAAQTYYLPSADGTSGNVLTTNGAGLMSWRAPTANTVAVTYVIDGGTSALTTGIKGDLQVPFAATIVGWSLLADASGTAQVDIWKDTFANYPPTGVDTITSAALKPRLNSQTANTGVVTGWTATTIAADDILRYNIDTTSTIKRMTLTLKCLKT